MSCIMVISLSIARHDQYRIAIDCICLPIDENCSVISIISIFLHFNSSPPIVLSSHIGDWCLNLRDFPLISGPSLNVQGDIKKFGSVKLW